ncbi:GPCR family 2 secretin-like [Trinorchestia longiramus]|nr:GPCR family 2 secretin-like [Trinorchestia longiramus]
MFFFVFIPYFIIACSKVSYSLSIQNPESIPNEGSTELSETFTIKLAYSTEQTTAESWLEENSTLTSTTDEADQRDDTTIGEYFPSHLQNFDEAEQSTTQTDPSVGVEADQRTILPFTSQGQNSRETEVKSHIFKSFVPSTTESVTFPLNEQNSSLPQTKNHRGNGKINESSSPTTEFNSGDTVDLTRTEKTVFPTTEGQTDDAAGLATQEERGENNQIFVASSTSAPDEETEGSTGEQSPEAAASWLSTPTPVSEMVTAIARHNEEEIGITVQMSSQVSKEDKISFNSSSSRQLFNNHFSTDYIPEGFSFQTTEMPFVVDLPENTSNEEIFTKNITKHSKLKDNSPIGKIFSADFQNNSRLGRAHDSLQPISVQSVNNRSSAEIGHHESLGEYQNLNKIDLPESLNEDREIMLIKNDTVFNVDQDEQNILVPPVKNTESHRFKNLTATEIETTSHTPTEVILKKLSMEPDSDKIEAGNHLNQKPPQDHQYTTNSSSARAMGVFMHLLKENQILRTLIYHIKNQASLNNGSEKGKQSSSLVHEPYVEADEKEHLPETSKIATPVEIQTSELDKNKSTKENYDEQVTSTLASIRKSVENMEHVEFSGTEKPPSQSVYTTEINFRLSDSENSNAETTSSPQLDYDDYLDMPGDFLADTDSTDLAYAINSTKVTPTKVVYSDPQPLPSDGHDELVFDETMVPSVRKCCAPNQFFSLEAQSCHDSQGPTYFDFYVRELILGNKSLALEFEYGRLSACPSTGEPPSIQVGISNYTHLLDLGYLYDIEMAAHFDHESYCLEMVGYDPETAELTAAFCVTTKAPQTGTSSIRKCCPLHNFFDASQGVCMPQGQGVGEIDELVREFSGTYTDSTSIETGILTCKSGISNPLDISKAYLNDGDQLCIADSGHCYPSSLYCIEYVMEEKTFHAQPMAVYCPLSSFKKCCPTHQILNNNICSDSEEPLSPYLTQLMATLYTKVGYPMHTDQVCVHLLLNSHDVRWWVTNSGYLSIDSGQNHIQTKNYCIDDSFENNEFVTIAHVCTDELKQSVGLPLSVFDKGTVGKCCPPNFHLSPELRDCSHGKSFHILDEDSLLMDANITKIGYTSFPHCESGKYHLYTFDESTGDHVVFGADSRLYVVSMDGKCIEMETPLDNAEFCLDYGWDAEEPERASAIVCAPPDYVTKYHSEKFNLISALLGVSCCSLIIALVSLISMRVRRGLVTVRKMNTLAGRILISYVTANFLGFLALAISMHVEAKEDTSVCMILSGIVQFFLLSAFFWNTSICSESLFLTLRVSMSEGRRLVYHSLWAWGLPALITTIALTLDAFRDRLPCGTITLRVGHLKCIFSDSDATLLYFYGPIALTLVANMALLLSAKQARLSKLQRLEMGPSKPPSTSNSTVANNKSRVRKTTVVAAPSPSHSGLRTHQNRNLWLESVRLVLWSGLTWVLEVIGFIVPRYISLQQERWHDYLWYLPASVNSLRGFGIFFILVMTSETRSKILRTIGTAKGKSFAMWKSERSQVPSKNNSYQPSSNNVSMNVSSSKYPVHNANKTRNMSVATTLTNITNLNSSLHGQDNVVHSRLVHSISQMERRESTTSSVSSFGEEEMENLELGGRRRSSVAPLSLPSVDEEDDDLVETSLAVVPMPKGSPTDSVFTRDSEA